MGQYTNSAGNQLTLVERWNGTSWSIQPTPNLTGALFDGLLAGVSCTSPTVCTAVGNRGNMPFGAGKEATLVERWNGTSWSIQPTPNPKGRSSPYSSLSAVSCASRTVCTAVGGGSGTTLVERWNGQRWAIQRTPQPTHSVGSGLLGVSCVSARRCTAVGEYGYGNGGIGAITSTLAPLAERWNGNRWAIQPTPKFPLEFGGSEHTGLFAVSCTSATACTAVGFTAQPPATANTWAEHWNGKRWMLQSTRNPRGHSHSSFAGVSCTSASTCTAVGQSGEALAEREA